MSGDYSRQRFDAQRDFSGVLMQQGRVQLDADWNEQAEILDRRMRAETTDILGRCVVPRITPDGFKIDLTKTGQLTIGRGRIYVDGLLAENHGGGTLEFDAILAEQRGPDSVLYEQQPYQPQPAKLAIKDKETHLVYIDVWQREVTFLEAPDLVESAVGVDTTTRRQTVWQVKVLPKDIGGATCGTPDDQLPGWLDLIRPSAGRLSTMAVEDKSEKSPCLLPSTVGFLGLANQLYRVEIHDGGSPKTATFKWSRDNASVVAAVMAIPKANTLIVDRTGRDIELRFNAGDWIEVTDDVREFAGRPGVLAKLVDVDPATRTLTLSSDLPSGEFVADADTIAARHTRIRRWDQKGPEVAASGGVIKMPPLGTPVVLEHGVQITFTLDPAGGRFQGGDYWVFAARTADASVERLDHAPPRGVHHHYGRLALVTLPATVSDCRTLWPPAHLALRYVGGDGQEARPGEPLLCPLTVGVEDEHGRPKTGIPVRFRDLGSGDLLIDVANPANAGPSILVTTDAAGMGRVQRTLSKQLGCHDVEATLESPPQGAALGVRFEAAAREIGEPTQKFPTIVSLKWLIGAPFLNDQPVPLDVFNRGLAVEFSEPMSPLTLLASPDIRAPNPNTFIVTLELPQLEQVQGGEIRLGGHRVFIVSGQVKPTDNENRIWVFSPRPLIRKEIMDEWLRLENQLFDSKFLRCRIVLKANCILDAAGRRPLDGDAFLRWADVNNNGAQDPNEFPLDVFGDGRQGGDFESWIWLFLG